MGSGAVSKLNFLKEFQLMNNMLWIYSTYEISSSTLHLASRLMSALQHCCPQEWQNYTIGVNNGFINSINVDKEVINSINVDRSIIDSIDFDKCIIDSIDVNKCIIDSIDVNKCIIDSIDVNF